jgi:SAM-dependent methyltransferase
VKTYSSEPGKERLRAVACPICMSTASREFLVGGGFRFVRCRSCRVVYQNPQPLFEDLQYRYGEAYFRYELENEDNFFRLMRLGLQDIRFEELTAGLAPTRRFLDIGCATGRLIAHMRDRGWVVQGVELCRESVEYGKANRGVEIFAGTLDQAGFAGESFDAVHFSHLIEHVPDPRGLLLEVRRILCPGGYIVVVTPNVDGLQARLFGSRWRSAIADHLTLFSKATLRHALGLAGFRVLRVATWGGLAMGSAPAWLKRPADRLAKRWGFGDVVLMLAQKLSL